MAEALKHIPVSPDSELARALDAAKSTGDPIAVDTGDIIYELFVSRTQPATPSDVGIARSIAGIKEAAGSWKGVERLDC